MKPNNKIVDYIQKNILPRYENTDSSNGQEHMQKLPDELMRLLHGYTYEANEVGCSTANVYHYQKGEESLFLKIEKTNEEIRREQGIIRWLRGKLPVPEVKSYLEQNGMSYLLMTAVSGEMTCQSPEDTLRKPYEETVRLLAEGLLMLQRVEIETCPFDSTLAKKLQRALYNIKNDLVDIEDFEESNEFENPIDLYHWLVEQQPEEELYFTHGDYCLPNIFIQEGQLSGFIDVGRGGIADKWQDIALCVRSLGYNLRDCAKKEQYVELLFEHLGIKPDWKKIDYYIMLDELF